MTRYKDAAKHRGVLRNPTIAASQVAGERQVREKGYNEE